MDAHPVNIYEYEEIAKGKMSQGSMTSSRAGKIEALPEVVEAVAGQAEVYLDGGIRRGTDVFKALALGARGRC